MDGILSNGCLIIIPGPKQETPTVTPDPYPQPDPQPDPQPAFILTIAVAVAISASIYISTTRRPVSTPFTFETCTDQTKKLRSSLEHITPDPTCIDMNPIRREVNEFWHHLKTVGLLGGFPIGEDYSPRLQEFTDCITYLGNHLPHREDPDPNINFVNALDIDYDYEHFKLKEEIRGILDKLEKFEVVVLLYSHSDYFKDRAKSKMTRALMGPNVSMYLFSASLLYKLLPIR